MNPRLTAAQTAEDDEELKRLVANARHAAEQYALSDSDPLLARCHAAEHWLSSNRARRREARQFEIAVGRLRDALRDGIDWWYVQEYYREARSFGQELPTDVTTAFAARARRRRVTLVMSVAVGSMVAVGAFVALWIG